MLWLLFFIQFCTLLNLCSLLHATKFISSLSKTATNSPYMIFHRHLFAKFSSETLIFSFTVCDIFERVFYKYSIFSISFFFFYAAKNLAIIWLLYTETAVMLTIIVSLFPCTSSNFHQSLPCLCSWTTLTYCTAIMLFEYCSPDPLFLWFNIK